MKELKEVAPKVLEGAGHVYGRKAPEYSHPPSLLLDPSLFHMYLFSPPARPHPLPAGAVTQGHGFPLSQPALLIFELDCRITNQAGIPKLEAGISHQWGVRGSLPWVQSIRRCTVCREVKSSPSTA